MCAATTMSVGTETVTQTGWLGEEITPWVQVVGLADAFDALIHPRVYKPAYPGEQASNMIVSGACGIFNPLLLACFARHIGEISQTVYSSAG